jgi:adenylate kinase family enzyme
MHVYRRETEPLIQYYLRQGILKDVEGKGPIDEVAERIGEALAA